MTKKLKYLLLALLFVVVGFGLFFSRKNTVESPKSSLSQNQSIITIDYGNGEKVTSSFTPQSGQTIFAALKSLTEEKNITLETQQYDFGIFVKTIGGYTSTSEMAWIYYVNGTSGTIAADQQEIKAGDIIEWRYIKPQE